MDLINAKKFIKQKQFGKALKIFLKLEKKTKDTSIYFYLGLLNFELNNYSKSILYYEKFIRENPGSIAPLINLAIVKQTIGELEESKKIYDKLIKSNKSDIRLYYGLYTLDPKNLNDEIFENLNEIKVNKKLNLYEDGIINFLLSKNEKKNKRYKNEIEYLKKSHKSIFDLNYAYNTSSQFYYKKIIGQNFNKIQIEEKDLKDIQQNEIEPIFIVGLPRSGSTLVESILTSTVEKLNTYGESHCVNMAILDQIGPKIYKKNFDYKKFKFELNLEKLNKNIINRYSELNIKEKKTEKFVDKSLENLFNLEIILNIFPKAKFLHTFRNPRDSIISIYQSMLPDLSWTHSIEDILNYFDKYLEVINFYKNKYPNKVMDVNLEILTSNSNKVSRDIIDFCDLTWNEDVLKFYKRKNLYSKTLSFAQIRSEVTKYDNNKYKPYFYLFNDYKTKFSFLKSN